MNKQEVIENITYAVIFVLGLVVIVFSSEFSKSGGLGELQIVGFGLVLIILLSANLILDTIKRQLRQLKLEMLKALEDDES